MILRKATKEPGELGDAATAVTKLKHPHFVKEEEYALPPLAGWDCKRSLIGLDYGRINSSTFAFTIWAENGFCR